MAQGGLDVHYTGRPGPLLQRCEQCNETTKPLSTCQGCKVTRYCCREHQVQHRPDHKMICSAIKRYRTKLDSEDRKIRRGSDNPFRNGVGHFWKIHETRDYMRARSPLSTKYCDLNESELKQIQDKLLRHVLELGANLRKTNDTVLRALLEPEDWLDNLPDMYGPGSPEEAAHVINSGFTPWWQTEGVFELLRAAQTLAAKDAEEDVEGMISSSTFKAKPGSDRTKEQLLHDVSINRMWAYLSDAVDDTQRVDGEQGSGMPRREKKARSEAEIEEDMRAEAAKTDLPFDWP